VGRFEKTSWAQSGNPPPPTVGSGILGRFYFFTKPLAQQTAPFFLGLVTVWRRRSSGLGTASEVKKSGRNTSRPRNTAPLPVMSKTEGGPSGKQKKGGAAHASRWPSATPGRKPIVFLPKYAPNSRVPKLEGTRSMLRIRKQMELLSSNSGCRFRAHFREKLLSRSRLVPPLPSVGSEKKKKKRLY